MLGRAAVARPEPRLVEPAAHRSCVQRHVAGDLGHGELLGPAQMPDALPGFEVDHGCVGICRITSAKLRGPAPRGDVAPGSRDKTWYSGGSNATRAASGPEHTVDAGNETNIRGVVVFAGNTV